MADLTGNPVISVHDALDDARAADRLAVSAVFYLGVPPEDKAPPFIGVKDGGEEYDIATGTESGIVEIHVYVRTGRFAPRQGDPLIDADQGLLALSQQVRKELNFSSLGDAVQQVFVSRSGSSRYVAHGAGADLLQTKVLSARTVRDDALSQP